MPYKEGKLWRAVPKYKGERFNQKKFPTKKEAVKYERDQVRRAKKIEKRQQGGMDLLTFCTKYLDFATKYQKKTYDDKKTVARRILTKWGPDRAVESITSEMVEEYLFEQMNNRSANAANKDRKNLLSMWNKGVKTYGLEFNPVSKTERFAHTVKPQYTPPIDDVLRLLAASDRKERVFLDCYLQTGARRSEIFRLTWDDVDFNRRTIRVGSRKTTDGSMKYRLLGLSDELYDSLWYWWKSRTIKDSPYVFVVDQVGPHYRKPYSQRRHFMARLCKKAGIKPFGFHALRRFVASVLDSKNVPLKQIQLILGHSKPTTTDRYIANIKSGMKEAMNHLSLGKVPRRGTPEKKEVNEKSR